MTAQTPVKRPEMPLWLRIGTIRYRVTLDADDWLRIEHSRKRQGDYGYCDHTVATIFINPGSADDVQRLTLWHEVMHALDSAVMGAPDWDDLGDNPTDREESVIRSWEHPVLAVLRDNPDLVAYLTASDR